MKRLLITIITLCPVLSFGVSFEQALVNAYDKAANFTIIKNDFLKDMETLPQTLSSYFLPNINARLNFGKNKSYYNNNKDLARKNETLENQLRLSQPLFNGGSGMAALVAAKQNFLYSKANYYAKEQSAILEALNVYLAYFAANEKYNFAIESFEGAKKQLIATQNKFKIGESTQSEYSTAVAGTASAETRKLSACAELEAARANFIKMFCMEPTEITLPKLPELHPNNFEELLTKVKLNNLEIKSLKEALTGAQSREIVEKGKLLPQVTLDLQASKSATKNQNATSFNSDRSLYSGISVNIPIYSQGGAEYSRIRLAKNDTKRTFLLLDNKIKEVETATIRNWEMFQAQKSSILAATSAVKASQVAYNATVEEHNVGNKSMLDVINMLERLNKSKSDKIDALVQYTKNAYEIKSLMGELRAKDFKINVTYFSPTKEYNKAKLKIIGF